VLRLLFAKMNGLQNNVNEAVSRTRRNIGRVFVTEDGDLAAQSASVDSTHDRSEGQRAVMRLDEMLGASSRGDGGEQGRGGDGEEDGDGEGDLNDDEGDGNNGFLSVADLV